MGSWPVMKDLIRFCFLLFFHPEMVLADGWTTIETPQPWCQKEGRPHHPTWTPHPSLFELKETTFSSLRATRPSSSIPLCLTFPLFPVSFLVWKLSRIRALLLGDHYPSLIIIFLFFLSSTEVSKFVFSCKVQALEEFILFSLEIVILGKTIRNGAWNEAGSGRDGMSRSLGRIFSLKKRWKKNGSQGLFTCWSMIIDGHLTDWNQLNKPLILWNQTYMQFESKKIMRNV